MLPEVPILRDSSNFNMDILGSVPRPDNPDFHATGPYPRLWHLWVIVLKYPMNRMRGPLYCEVGLSLCSLGILANPRGWPHYSVDMYTFHFPNCRFFHFNPQFGTSIASCFAVFLLISSQCHDGIFIFLVTSFHFLTNYNVIMCHLCEAHYHLCLHVDKIYRHEIPSKRNFAIMIMGMISHTHRHATR